MNDAAPAPEPISWGIDTATPCTPYADQIAQHCFDGDPAKQIKFVIRYYRHGEPGNPWSIQPAEAQKLWDRGLHLGVVFQGGKSSTTPGYFSAAQGARDAEAALRRADQLRQPDGTAIAFAVDTDIVNKTIEDVCAYFTKVRQDVLARRPELWITCYGDDRVCRTLHERGLVDVTWLANAKGWREEKAFEGWHIRQGMETTLPFGLGVDPNECRSLKGAGLWRE